MTESRALVLWAFMLSALTLVLLGWTRDRLQLGLLGGAAAATLGMTLLVIAAGGRPEARRLPVASLGAPLVALGIAGVALGVVFGAWLWAPGAAIVLLGLVAWVREGKE
jgi:hypothetical protein